MNKKFLQRILFIFMGLALLLRVLICSELAPTPCLAMHKWQMNDMHRFHLWAQSIVGGDWLGENVPRSCPGDFTRQQWQQWYAKTYPQAPLYPYLLALFYRICGNHPQYFLCLQLLVGVITLALLYYLTLLMFNAQAAFIAAILYIICGPFYFYEMLLLRASWLTLLTLLVAVVSLIAMKRDQWQWWLALGIICGVALLMRESIVLFIFLMTIFLVYTGKKRACAIMFIGILPLIALLAWRNALVASPWLSISASGAYTLANENAYGSSGYIPSNNPLTKKILMETQGRFWATAWRCLLSYRHDPWALWQLLFRKCRALWQGREIANNASYYYFCQHSWWLSRTINWTWISPLVICGFVLSWRYARNFISYYMLWLSLVATMLLLVVIGRYRIHFIALSLPLAAHACTVLWEWLRQKRYCHASVGIGIIFVLTWILTPPGYSYYKRPTDFYWAGKHYLRQGLPHKALIELQHAARLGTDADLPKLEKSFARNIALRNYGVATEAYRHIGLIYQQSTITTNLQQRQQFSAMAKQAFAQAESAMSRIIARNPKPEFRFRRGHLRILQERYREAISDYSYLLNRNPNLATAYNNRAIAYYKLGDYQKAYRDWQQAIRLSPSLAKQLTPHLRQLRTRLKLKKD